MATANECIPYFEPGAAITAKAEAAVVGKRFVDISDDIEGSGSSPPNSLDDSPTGGSIVCSPATAAGHALGVASYDAGAGADFYVLCQPGVVLPVTADGALTAGQQVEVGTAGKALAQDAGRPVGRVLADAADGTDAMILFYGHGHPAE
jgi:hypothetical protein